MIRLLLQQIAGLRRQLADHPLYHQIRTEADLRVFLEHHVFAVWDFMSLLKSLQRELTCVDVPWLPAPLASGQTARLINEIVLGEESDQLPDGRVMSHFHLYREAMKGMGASGAGILALLERLEHGQSVEEALSDPAIPAPARSFVRATFTLIESGHLPSIAAAFTFGREDVIPDMFRSLVAQLSASSPGVEVFRLYLDRHIELDGDHHSKLATQMLEEICGADEAAWHQAIVAARGALQARLSFWDGILSELDARQPSLATLGGSGTSDV